MAAYYNENEPYAAEWLRNLIRAGFIAKGDVDERSIVEVAPGDLKGYTQCHFFAGIGGWSLALRMAGWSDDRPVWTGSCPCQPFSVAGKGDGVADARHLWPEFYRLIAECKPSVVFGEQVAAKAGREWLAGVFTDLEGVGYAVAGTDLCAAGVGAPHIRQRLWWVADSAGAKREARRAGEADARQVPQFERCGAVSRLADNLSPRLEGHTGYVADGHQPGRDDPHAPGSVTAGGGDSGLADPESSGYGRRADEPRGQAQERVATEWGSDSSGLQHPASDGRQQRRPEPGERGVELRRGEAWAADIWIPCADGKARRIEPGIEPLAHGVPARVGKLRAYGNAIVPEVAAEFITAYMDCQL